MIPARFQMAHLQIAHLEREAIMGQLALKPKHLPHSMDGTQDWTAFNPRIPCRAPLPLQITSHGVGDSQHSAPTYLAASLTRKKTSRSRRLRGIQVWSQGVGKQAHLLALHSLLDKLLAVRLLRMLLVRLLRPVGHTLTQHQQHQQHRQRLDKGNQSQQSPLVSHERHCPHLQRCLLTCSPATCRQRANCRGYLTVALKAHFLSQRSMLEPPEPLKELSVEPP